MYDQAIDLYPTRDETIDKMLADVKLGEIGDFLEPGAGRGHICDYIKKQFEKNRYKSGWGHRDPDIDVIEIDPECQHVLRGKGYRLVHNDFLSFETYKAYDLIIANFPFSVGDRHLQKALSILERGGGMLRCLVNAETIRNPFTNLRKGLLQSLNRLGAEIEFFTDEFVDAERPTDVEVALVKVAVEKEHKVSVILDSLKPTERVDRKEFHDEALVDRDYKRAFVSRFNLEASAGSALIDEWKALQPFILNRVQRPDDEHDYSKPLIKLEVEGTYSSSSRADLVNKYLQGLREKFWALLIHHLQFTASFTSNILEELDAKLRDLRNYDFNLFNIAELEKELRSKIVQGIEEAILAMFDEFSTKYAYDESIHNGNVHYYNGWKSNKAHKINKKIVLPMNGLDSGYDSRRPLRWDYYIHKRLADMVKVFHYLGQENIDVMKRLNGAMEQAEIFQNFRNVNCVYFAATFYKKRTCHIKFLDQDLLDKFNIFGSQRRGWLPPCYGKKPYDDLDAEEREVIDSFQGREKYEEVVRRADYYIVDTSRLLLGTSLVEDEPEPEPEQRLIEAPEQPITIPDDVPDRENLSLFDI